MSSQARSNNQAEGNVVTLEETGPAFVAFSDLVLGDRFQPVYAVGDEFPQYTKTRHDLARCHSLESIALKKQGFGYLEDPIVAIPGNEKVKFIPV